MFSVNVTKVVFLSSLRAIDNYKRSGACVYANAKIDALAEAPGSHVNFSASDIKLLVLGCCNIKHPLEVDSRP